MSKRSPDTGSVSDGASSDDELPLAVQPEIEVVPDADWGTVIEAPDVSDSVKKESEYPIASGGFGDVYKGKWNPKYRGMLKAVAQISGLTKIVAIKVIRPPMDGPMKEKFERRLIREINLWQRLHHENILPMIGVSYGFGSLPSPISPWQANGTVKEYVQANPDANRLELIRGVSSGLTFLHDHDPSVTHGDMKADNILVNDWGNVYLSDFGISTVVDDAAYWKTQTTTVAGTGRYMSKELLVGTSKATPASDVWAFAMTCLEILTSQVPFAQYSSDAAVMIAVVVRDERPSRPTSEDITDELWNMLEDCWRAGPPARPHMRDVTKRLTRLCASEKPLRLLSIDGGGIRAIMGLHCLKMVVQNVPGNVKPCDYFDMIAGSGTGGLVALMLGRLRMSVDECLEALPKALTALYESPVDHQRSQLSKNKFRFDSWVFHDKLRELIINEHLEKKERDTHDRRPRACKTFVVAEKTEEDVPQPLLLRTYTTRDHPPFPNRLYVALGATCATPTCFEQSMAEGFSIATWCNHIVERVNPTSELLDETRDVFGEHRRTGCLVSLGNGIASSMFAPDASYTDGLPDSLVNYLKASALGLETVDIEVAKKCEPGSYFRFDPVDVIVEKKMNKELWQAGYAWERQETLEYMMQLAQEYMGQNEVSQQAMECAARLHPRKPSSTSSSLSLDSLSLSPH